LRETGHETAARRPVRRYHPGIDVQTGSRSASWFVSQGFALRIDKAEPCRMNNRRRCL